MTTEDDNCGVEIALQSTELSFVQLSQHKHVSFKAKMNETRKWQLENVMIMMDVVVISNVVVSRNRWIPKA